MGIEFQEKGNRIPKERLPGLGFPPPVGARFFQLGSERDQSSAFPSVPGSECSWETQTAGIPSGSRRFGIHLFPQGNSGSSRPPSSCSVTPRCRGGGSKGIPDFSLLVALGSVVFGAERFSKHWEFWDFVWMRGIAEQGEAPISIPAPRFSWNFTSKTPALPRSPQNSRAVGSALAVQGTPCHSTTLINRS